MPSGYEKSPDYGGPDPSWRGFVVGIVCLAVIAIVVAAWPRGVHIVDGDTFDNNGWRMRLWGIDSPERGAKCQRNGESWDVYGAASDALGGLIGNAPVICLDQTLDPNWLRYWPPRWVGKCHIAGYDLADAMVRSGWACDYTKYSKGHYKEAQAEAQTARRGLWQCDKPPPWKCKG